MFETNKKSQTTKLLALTSRLFGTDYRLALNYVFTRFQLES